MKFKINFELYKNQIVPYFLCLHSYKQINFTYRFADKQVVRLQETPDDIPDGGTPHTVSLLMHDKLVDAGKPGDRVEVRPYMFILSLLNLESCIIL